MEISIAKEARKFTISVNGTINTEGAEKLKKSFNQLQTAPPPNVILNVSGVSQIGSSGIGGILLFYKNLAIKNSSLEVAGLSPILYELFQELKLDSLFPISRG